MLKNILILSYFFLCQGFFLMHTKWNEPPRHTLFFQIRNIGKYEFLHGLKYVTNRNTLLIGNSGDKIISYPIFEDEQEEKIEQIDTELIRKNKQNIYIKKINFWENYGNPLLHVLYEPHYYDCTSISFIYSSRKIEGGQNQWHKIWERSWTNTTMFSTIVHNREKSFLIHIFQNASIGYYNCFNRSDFLVLSFCSNGASITHCFEINGYIFMIDNSLKLYIFNSLSMIDNNEQIPMDSNFLVNGMFLSPFFRNFILDFIVVQSDKNTYDLFISCLNKELLCLRLLLDPQNNRYEYIKLLWKSMIPSTIRKMLPIYPLLYCFSFDNHCYVLNSINKELLFILQDVITNWSQSFESSHRSIFIDGFDEGIKILDFFDDSSAQKRKK